MGRVLGALWDPGFPKCGETSGERAGLVHRECARLVFSAPKRLLALEEPGGYA